MEQNGNGKMVEMAGKNQIAGVRTFYVSSDNPKTPEKKYIVVEIKRDSKTTYFCNCEDFFARKLPFLGLNLFSHCKHGQLVKDAVTRG